MGNACCGYGGQAVIIAGNSNDEKGNNLITGDIGDEDNVIVPKVPEPKRDSDLTVFYDCIDRFPSEDMMYPPTQSMRQLPVEFDMRKSASLKLLLNSSCRELPTAASFDSASSPPSKTIRPSARQSAIIVSEFLTAESPGTQGRGYPGELDGDELETCLKFREELKKRDPALKEMVMAMHPYENEAFALCRFLRARDFDIDEVFAMLKKDKQAENWHAVKRQDPTFFKDFHKAIPEFNGCPLSVFMTQYPMMHTGIGRNGAVVVYIRAGDISCPGVECIVGDMANALPFNWNQCYHGCRDAMEREIARSDGSDTTVLAEKIIVVDLAGDSSLFTSGMQYLMTTPTAGSCFPESVNRTYILNAPFSFTMVWTIIRQMIDSRTLQKIGFFSTIAKANEDFLKHIDSRELLSSYGGTGQSFGDVFGSRQRELAQKEGMVRYVVELLDMNGRQKGFDFDLSSKERVDSIVVYSRSDNCCEISVVDGKCNYVVNYTDVKRENATSVASNPADKDKSHNNYSVKIATPEHFADNPTGPFFVNAKGGTKGDYFLVAISIAEKR